MEDRKEFINELKTRKYVRERIKRELKEEKEKEEKLRKAVRGIIREAKSTDIPFKQTGINVLRDVLKKITPIIREDYKDLTTSKSQRESFRKHVMKAVQQIILPIRNYFEAGEDQERKKGKKDKFIEVPKATGDNEKSQQNEEDEDKIERIPGLDETGRNLAIRTFDKIESNIIDAYKLLANEEDREIFYDYLLTNLKLYFERWEEELSGYGAGEEGEEVPEEVLEEEAGVRFATKGNNPNEKQNSGNGPDGNRGWRVFKEQAQSALHEDDWKEFEDLSKEEIIKQLKQFKARFENTEDEGQIEKLEKKIGGALAALWKKKETQSPAEKIRSEN